MTSSEHSSPIPDEGADVRASATPEDTNARRDGVADRTYGSAETEPDDRPGPSTAVHGDEGGGDPAAGAEEDSAPDA